MHPEGSPGNRSVLIQKMFPGAFWGEPETMRLLAKDSIPLIDPVASVACLRETALSSPQNVRFKSRRAHQTPHAVPGLHGRLQGRRHLHHGDHREAGEHPPIRAHPRGAGAGQGPGHAAGQAASEGLEGEPRHAVETAKSGGMSICETFIRPSTSCLRIASCTSLRSSPCRATDLLEFHPRTP